MLGLGMKLFLSDFCMDALQDSECKLVKVTLAPALADSDPGAAGSGVAGAIVPVPVPTRTVTTLSSALRSGQSLVTEWF